VRHAQGRNVRSRSARTGEGHVQRHQTGHSSRFEITVFVPGTVVEITGMPFAVS